MLMNKRTFTIEEKLRIIAEAKEKGVTATIEKYGIYAASYYSWKKKLDLMGEEGLQHGMTPEHQKPTRQFTSLIPPMPEKSNTCKAFGIFYTDCILYV